MGCASLFLSSIPPFHLSENLFNKLQQQKKKNKIFFFLPDLRLFLYSQTPTQEGSNDISVYIYFLC